MILKQKIFFFQQRCVPSMTAELMTPNHTFHLEDWENHTIPMYCTLHLEQSCDSDKQEYLVSCDQVTNPHGCGLKVN